MGLILNLDKSIALRLGSVRLLHYAYIVQGERRCPICSPSPPNAPGSLIPLGQSTKYLGATIATTGSSTLDLNAKLSKASKAFFLLKPFFKHPSISNRWKFQVYSQVLQAMILYSSESQVFTPTQVKRLDSFHFRVMRAILRIKSSCFHKIIADTGMPSSHQHVAKLAVKNGFKGQILSQAANTNRFKLFGHIARHPESIEHKIIYRSCHSFRSRSSPYRVGRPRAHWAEVTSAQLIQRIVWLTKRPPPHDWEISHPLRSPISQPEVWHIHGHSLHDFHKNSAQIWRATRQTTSNRDRWKYISKFSIIKDNKSKKKRPM